VSAASDTGTLNMSTPEETARLAALAEEAYDAIYEARNRRDAKESYDDACGCLIRAMDIARTLGLSAEAERLQKRLDHIIGVYTHQFR
jgi:hypothetical protein